MEKLHIFLYTITIAAIIYIIVRQSSKKNNNTANGTQSNTIQLKAEDRKYQNSYRKRSLFTYNEKYGFNKIKVVTDKLRLIPLSKVRLYDLIEPVPGVSNYKGALWKIQSKHVDFVICNQALEAKVIIELDDNSHNRRDRIERDIFVDTILKKAGYKIIRTRGINEITLEDELIKFFEIPTQETLEQTQKEAPKEE